MRPIYLSDLDCAARVLMAQPRQDWQSFAARLKQEVQAADAYTKQYRKSHPRLGVGTLTDCAMQYPRSKVPYCNAHYRDAMIILLQVFKHQSA